jgi:zinc/manganese transport system substrate-binding protein
MLTRRHLLAAALLAPVASSASAQDGGKVEALTSFSILADFVRQVGGDRVNVRSIVGRSQSLHDFQPSPGDVQKVAKAHLIVVNGLGLEPWAARFLNAAQYKGESLAASKGVQALSVRGVVDPHAWLDVENAKLYVDNIREALTKVDPAHAAVYARNTSAYARELDRLHQEIKAGFNAIPKSRRKVIASHDAFNYFGDAYGLAFVAPQGMTSGADPSARDVARVITQIRDDNIKAIFIENASSQQIIRRIASETGVKVAGKLYADALDGSVNTYVKMMRHNYAAIIGAIR